MSDITGGCTRYLAVLGNREHSFTAAVLWYRVSSTLRIFEFSLQVNHDRALKHVRALKNRDLLGFQIADQIFPLSDKIGEVLK